MNNLEKYLSKETKEILLNFFTLNIPFSKKKFENLLISKEKYQNRRWDEKTSIVNFLLSHPTFKISKTSLNNLKLLSLDWSSINNEEENSLFLLLKKDYELKEIIELSIKLDINYKQKNKENLYFINYILNEKSVIHIVNQAYKGINNFPEIRLQKYFKKYLEVLLQFPELFKETAIFEKNKFEKIKLILETPEFRQYNKNKIGISLEDEIKKIETALLYLSLENHLEEKSIKTKKLKI